MAGHYLFDSTIPPREPEGSMATDEGADDLWPSEPPQEKNPETVVVRQWGLQLPDGSVNWGSWQSIPFDNPLDRLRMIATLQQTALNIGFGEGEQVAEFLGRYQWCTRDATVATVFSDIVKTFALGDPIVAEVNGNGDSDRREENDGPGQPVNRYATESVNSEYLDGRSVSARGPGQ